MKDFTGIDVMILIIFGILAIVACVALNNESSQKWKNFAIKHNCKQITIISGDTLVAQTVGGNGIISVVTTPDKIGYKCDDGVTYYR